MYMSMHIRLRPTTTPSQDSPMVETNGCAPSRSLFENPLSAHVNVCTVCCRVHVSYAALWTADLGPCAVNGGLREMAFAILILHTTCRAQSTELPHHTTMKSRFSGVGVSRRNSNKGQTEGKAQGPLPNYTEIE